MRKKASIISLFNGPLCSSLRVAEHVWGQGPLISEYPAEALTIKNLDDSMALLASEDGQERFETKVRSWMKNITDLLQEGEQLRLETDGQGPQDEIEFWKAKAAHLTLVVDEMMAPPTKMTLPRQSVFEAYLSTRSRVGKYFAPRDVEILRSVSHPNIISLEDIMMLG